MSLESKKLINAVASICMQIGVFERVNMHEPKSPPGNGLSAAVWIQTIGPSGRISGLSSTAALVGFMIRIYTNFVADPADYIDPNVMDAVDQLIAQFSGDFDLEGFVFSTDLLGSEGVPLSAKAGYAEMNGKIFRIMDVTVRMAIDNVWEQSP